MGHIRFSISLPLQPCLYVARVNDISLLKRSCDSEQIPFGDTYIMHALMCINQRTKFEVPSFTNYKDMIGGKIKKTGHVTMTTPF